MPRKSKITVLHVPVEQKTSIVSTGPVEKHIICLKVHGDVTPTTGSLAAAGSPGGVPPGTLGIAPGMETLMAQEQSDSVFGVAMTHHPIDQTRLCWHCCHPFDTVPCKLPLRFTNNTFHVKGHFCSYNCALAYAYENRMQSSIPLVHFLNRKVNHLKEHVHIKRAPPREVLSAFGGSMSIQDFRNHFTTNTRFTLATPPMIEKNDLIESYETRTPTSVRPHGKIDLAKIKQDRAKQSQRSVSPVNLEKLMCLKI